MDAELRKLRDRAESLLEKGKAERALEAFTELCRKEPESSRWHQKCGELHRRLGHPEKAADAFTEAARRLAGERFLVKAIALCRAALGADPGSLPAHDLLEQLCAVAQPAPRPVTQPGRPTMPGTPPRPESERPRRRTVPPGGTLSDVRLAEVVADARPLPAPEGYLQPAVGRVFEIPLEADEPGQARPRIPATPLLPSLEPAALRTLVQRLSVIEIAPGQPVFEEGAAGDSLYIIVEGEVVIERRGPPARKLGTLGEGAFFGEFAWLTSRPRSARAVAIGPVTLLEVSREVMADLVDEHLSVLRVLLRFFRERMVQNLTASSELFASFTEAERRSLAGRFSFLELEPGTEIIRQGQLADGLYLLLCGELEVRRESGRAERRIALLGEGSLVGEISLLTHGPAVASIRAASRSWALKLGQAVFQEVILTHPQVLAFLSELAEKRQALNAAIAAEEVPYQEHRLELV